MYALLRILQFTFVACSIYTTSAYSFRVSSHRKFLSCEFTANKEFHSQQHSLVNLNPLDPSFMIHIAKKPNNIERKMSWSLYSSTLPISDNYGPVSNPGLFHIKVKGKLINLWGIYCAIVTFLVALMTYPFVLLSTLISDLSGNKKQRRVLDWVVHIWAKICITLCGGAPKLLGAENLPKRGETVMYVPNHTSFLDILFFSGFVPRPFKYFSKAEIGKIPIIGSSMKLAKHIFLKRDDIRSSIESTALCVQRLKDGNSMVVFAEGTRSSNGRLQTFKKGAFQIAKEAGVKIIPVSIGNLYRWMPNAALLPLAPMRDTYIKIHPPLDSTALPVSQLKNLCLEAVNSGLPDYQKSTMIKPSESSKPQE